MEATRTIQIPMRQVPVKYSADVVVIGGGAAGVAAAVSAAREGAKVILIERGGFLGGTMTSTSLGGICGLFTLVEDQPVQIIQGFAEEIRDRLERYGGTNGPLVWLQTASLPYDLFVLKTIFDEVTSHANIKILYQTYLVGSVCAEKRVNEIIVLSRNGEEFGITSQNFIDCSGDASLCHQSGASTHYDVKNLQYPTTMFRMGGVDTKRAMTVTRPEMHSFLEHAVRDGYPLPRTAGGIYSVREGVVHLNITKVSFDDRPPDPFDVEELSACEYKGRQQARMYLDVFRKYVPGYRNAYILDCGVEIGIRETRRIKGDYILSSDDIINEKKFPDAIAKNCWPIEDHGKGRDARWVWLRPGGFNHVPYRSLLSADFENLIAAGRCVSATHNAQAALRVTANCFSMGQAAGAAAAMAGDYGYREVDTRKLQESLASAGASIDPIPEA